MKFEMTEEGYKEAIEYLKSLKKYEKEIDNKDGYSIVYLANYLYEKYSETF